MTQTTATEVDARFVERSFSGRISGMRAFGALLFGLAYGGGVVNGVDRGLAYVSGNLDYSVLATPDTGLALYWASTVLIGLFAGYVGRSVTLGGLAAAFSAALLLLIPRFLFVESLPSSTLLFAASTTGFVAGVIAAAVGSRLPVEPSDIERGRVLGVSWGHWLWLWLPWQYVISNAVWLGTPKFVLTGDDFVYGLADIPRSVIGAGVILFAGWMALRSLRTDAGTSRPRSAVLFVAWFLVAPILVNLWRLL